MSHEIEWAPRLRFVGPRGAPRVRGERAGQVLEALAVTPRLDVVSAWRLLAFAEYDVQRSFFEQVEQVPLGCTVVPNDDGTLRVERPLVRPSSLRDPAVVAAEIRRLLRASVEESVASARRVAVLLSGGLDSGVVAAAARVVWGSLGRDPADLAAFHGAPPPEAGPGERERAEIVARHLGLPLRVHTARALADPFAGCDDMLRLNDLPSDDGGFLHARDRLTAIRDAGFDTVLTGDGGDEVFGDWWVRPWRRSSPVRTGLALAEFVARAAVRPVRDAIVGRRVALERKAGVLGTPAWLLAQAPAEPHAIGYAPPPKGLHGARAERWGRAYAARQRVLLSWWRAWGECLGLTIRCPLLSLPVVGFVASLNPGLFRTSPVDRALLRRAAAGDLPAEALQWPKQVPEAMGHLRRDVRDHGSAWMEAHVQGTVLERVGLAPRREWADVVARGSTGHPMETFRALALPSLGAWCRARGV